MPTYRLPEGADPSDWTALIPGPLGMAAKAKLLTREAILKRLGPKAADLCEKFGLCTEALSVPHRMTKPLSNRYVPKPTSEAVMRQQQLDRAAGSQDIMDQLLASLRLRKRK